MVGHVGHTRHGLERELADAHAGIKRHGHAVDVRYFEDDGAFESGIDVARGGVHDDAKAAERAASFHTGDKVVREFDFFQRHAQHEFMWLNDERCAGFGDFDEFGAVLEAFGIHGIEHGLAGVVVDLEKTAQEKVHAGGVDVLQVVVFGRGHHDFSEE